MTKFYCDERVKEKKEKKKIVSRFKLVNMLLMFYK